MFLHSLLILDNWSNTRLNCFLKIFIVFNSIHFAPEFFLTTLIIGFDNFIQNVSRLNGIDVFSSARGVFLLMD